MNDVHPAIILVGYDRPDSMQRLYKSVLRATYPCNDITLIISIDESPKSDDVEKAIIDIEWPYGERKICRYKERMGLKKHIISCGNLTKEYGAVIILEDDLYVSPEFYKYTLSALNKYQGESSIAGIALYSHCWNGYSNFGFIPDKDGFDCYLGQFSITWGQCWTEQQWNGFKKWFDKQNDTFPYSYELPADVADWGPKSWGKFFFKYIVENNMFYVIPYDAMSTNFSDTGEHCSAVNTAHQVPLAPINKKEYVFADIKTCTKYDAFFERIFDSDIIINGIHGNEICCDLNLCRQKTNGKRYLLSMRKLNLRVIKSFGLSLRPIEKNIIYNIDGNDIFLYDTQECVFDLPKIRKPLVRIAYEMYGIEWDQQIRLGCHILLAKIKRKIKKILRKKR